MQELWNTLLVDPLFNALMVLYKYTGSVGVAIVVLSIAIRLVLYPLYTPTLKMSKKQRELKPELDKIKEKYKHDKKKYAEAQMELYRKHGINPASGCVTNIFIFLIPVALYGVIRQITGDVSIEAINSRLYFDFLKLPADAVLNLKFLYLNLAKPDKALILPVLTAALQFASSKMMMPAVEVAEKLAKKTPDKTDDLAYNMQQQMLYMLPVMMLFFGFTLPSGVMLNILVSTVLSIVQNYRVSGWGALGPFVSKLGIPAVKRSKK